MAKFLLIVTIVLTMAAAFFGYQTKGKLEDVQKTIQKAKNDTSDATTKLKAAKDELKASQLLVAAANEKAQSDEAAAVKAKADADKATADAADLKGKLDAKQAELDAAIAKSGTNTGTQVPVVADPAAEAKLKDAEAKAKESEQLAQTLQEKLKSDEEKIQSLSAEEERHKRATMRPGLEGQVMAVNQGWNFAVISIGDRQGAVANAQLIVKRGDTMIGRIKITSVEPSTSIADILPDTVAKGQRVLPGDRVVFPVQ